jgi:aminoglycoside phosphotransferase (APT) family kinase protein
VNDLEAYLSGRLGYRVRLRERRVAAQGLSDQTLVLRAEGAGGQRDDLVVRVRRPGGLLRSESDPRAHYELLRALGDTEVPVPRVRWYEEDDGVLGGPFFVMDEVPGHVPVPWSPDGRAFLAHAGEGPIGEAFPAVLAAIHSVKGVPAREAHGIEWLAALVDEYRSVPEPILTDALLWLRDHVPEPAEPVLVHGDYRTGNLIYDGDRIAAVLDWEFACVGDPAIDLAWVCAASNRMGSELVCQLLPRERFLTRYAVASGRVVDEARLRFWELFHQVRHTAIWLSSTAAYAAGRTRDLRLARMAYTLPTMRRLVANLLGGYA